MTQLPLFTSAYPDTAYSGASVQRKELADWRPTVDSADAELLPEWGALVARSRDLARNHGIAAAGFQVHVDNIVGSGLRLAAQPDYRALNKSIEWAGEWSRTVESAWKAYSDSAHIDAGRQMNFADMTALVLRTCLMSGDCFILPLWIEDPSFPFATKFQVIEGERVSNPEYKHNTQKLRNGIEVDEYGKPEAYWFHKPSGEEFWLGTGMYLYSGTWSRVPARTKWGRKRVIHVFDRERAGQSRGKPLLSPVLEQFKMFDHYQRVELQSSIVNSLVAGVIETPMDQAQIMQLMNGDPNAYLAMKNQWQTSLKGGAVVPLYPGDKLTPFIPTRPATQYPDFVATVLRHIATALQMPYELLVKDFTKTNYSSARAALLEAWRYFMHRRKWLSEHWAQEAYELWLEEAIAKGYVEAPDFYEKRPWYTHTKFIGPGRGWIDPVKEVQAAVVRMNAGISTLELECAEQGLDWQDVCEQKAREFARMRELGIFEYVNATAAAQQAQAMNQQKEDSRAGGTAPGAEKADTGDTGVKGLGGEYDKSGEEYGE